MARANLDRNGIRAMAKRYAERRLWGAAAGAPLNYLADFGALVAREVRRSERDRRLQQLELRMTRPKARG